MESNSITGSLDHICITTDNSAIIADCGGRIPELICNCCEPCCEDGVQCHDHDLLGQFDPEWETSYIPKYILIDDLNISEPIQ